MKVLCVFFLRLCMGVLALWSVSARAADLSEIAQIYAGSNHNCALARSGAAYCWGFNVHKQLSRSGGDALFLATKVDVGNDVVQISPADRHTCVLHKDGTVSCWGLSAEGQVGNAKMGPGTYPPAKVNGLADVVMIGSGWSHTCAMTRGGRVYCWGRNKDGQVVPDRADEVTSPTAVAGLENVSAIGVGGSHTCAVSAGKVYCWGNNRYLQLGAQTSFMSRDLVQVSGLSDVTRLAAGAFHNCAIDTTGQTKCWGHNRYGQLGDGTTTNSAVPKNVVGHVDSTITSLAAGGHHTCATNGTRTYCWGNNRHGQLGHDVFTDVNSTPVPVGKVSPLKEIAAGGYHNCAITSDSKVQCWGGNRHGQVGSGSVGNISFIVTVRD